MMGALNFRTSRRVTVVALMITGLCTITACAAANPYADIPQSQLPQSVVETLGEPIAPSVHEFGKDSNGYSYFTARWEGDTSNETCLVVETPSDFASACSGDFPVVLGLLEIRVELHETQVQPEEGIEIVGEYVTVRGL